MNKKNYTEEEIIERLMFDDLREEHSIKWYKNKYNISTDDIMRLYDDMLKQRDIRIKELKKFTLAQRLILSAVVKSVENIYFKGFVEVGDLHDRQIMVENINMLLFGRGRIKRLKENETEAEANSRKKRKKAE